jgi:site-specific DNA-methyltransferase (adenine-specific)
MGGYKVFIPKAGDGHGRIPAVVLGRPVCTPPDTVCTQTFLIAGSFESKEESEKYAAYLRTKFVRFLILQRKASQDNYADTFGFVPDLPMDREWADQDLYERYELTEDEIEVIESHIKEMPAEPGDEGDA